MVSEMIPLPSKAAIAYNQFQHENVFYPVKPIIPINLESFLSVIAQFMPSLLILALIIMWSIASSVDFSNGRGMYFIVSTSERTEHHFLSTRLKDSRSVTRFGKGVKFIDNIFFFYC
jgi:hypothetical protein